ncbi:MAG: hypothetical protein JXQ99_29270 [Hyphomicrobiaceae bacterium]
MIKCIATSSALVFAALSTAGCGAGSLLKTGSVATKPVAATPKPATSIDRALHVASTSARAQKCGFYFDAPALRTSFLTAEAARGTAVEVLSKTSQSYDYTALKVASAIKQSETYCTKARTASIKTSLQGALAGNYDPPVKNAVAQSSGLADLLETDNAGPEKFDRDSIYDPVLNEKKSY